MQPLAEEELKQIRGQLGGYLSKPRGVTSPGMDLICLPVRNKGLILTRNKVREIIADIQREVSLLFLIPSPAPPRPSYERAPRCTFK